LISISGFKDNSASSGYIWQPLKRLPFKYFVIHYKDIAERIMQPINYVSIIMIYVTFKGKCIDLVDRVNTLDLNILNLEKTKS